MEELNNIDAVDSIDLHELFLILWKNVVLIALTTVVVTSLALAYTKFFVSEKYASDTYVQISSNIHGGNLSDLQFSKGLVKNFIAQAKSRTVLMQVIEDKSLNLNMSYDELKGKVNVSQLTDTDIIKIEVTTTNPELSAKIANKVSDYLTEFVEKDMNVLGVRQYDLAIPNMSPVSPNTLLNTVIGFVLGGMLSVGFILLKEFMNRTVRTPKDVEKYLGVPVLGTVPNMDKKYIGD